MPLLRDDQGFLQTAKSAGMFVRAPETQGRSKSDARKSSA
jgi:hypothetical protein